MAWYVEPLEVAPAEYTALQRRMSAFLEIESLTKAHGLCSTREIACQNFQRMLVGMYVESVLYVRCYLSFDERRKQRLEQSIWTMVR